MKEEKFEIPVRFKASINPKDAEAYLRLQGNDEEQKKLGEKINSPFSKSSPLDVARSKAYITLQMFNTHPPTTNDQLEQLAEAYATTGRYDLAARLSKTRHEEYAQVWVGVWLPDDERCEHPEKHWYVVQRIFSVKENREVPLMKCNVCKMVNVMDGDAHLQTHKQSQVAHRGKTHSDINAARNYHTQFVAKT